LCASQGIKEGEISYCDSVAHWPIF